MARKRPCRNCGTTVEMAQRFCGACGQETPYPFSPKQLKGRPLPPLRQHEEAEVARVKVGAEQAAGTPKTGQSRPSGASSTDVPVPPRARRSFLELLLLAGMGLVGLMLLFFTSVIVFGPGMVAEQKERERLAREAGGGVEAPVSVASPAKPTSRPAPTPAPPVKQAAPKDTSNADAKPASTVQAQEPASLKIGEGSKAESFGGEASALKPASEAPKLEQPKPAAPQDRFVESDFYWDADTSKFKPQIITVVNKIARENSRCKTIDPSSVMLSGTKSKPGDPVFFVTCGERYNTFNVWFRPGDAENDTAFAAKKNLAKGPAVDACEAAARSRATHPSTVEFSRIMDLGYIAHPSGRTTVLSTFTAKNAFNLELEHTIRCLFEGATLIEVTIEEAR